MAMVQCYREKEISKQSTRQIDRHGHRLTSFTSADYFGEASDVSGKE